MARRNFNNYQGFYAYEQGNLPNFLILPSSGSGTIYDDDKKVSKISLYYGISESFTSKLISNVANEKRVRDIIFQVFFFVKY